MFRLLLLAVVVRLGSSFTKQDCPYGLERNQYLQVFGDSCYHFEMTKFADFTHAKRVCRKIPGGHLALVKSQDVNDFLAQQLLKTYSNPHSTWIGLSDKEEENKFVWDDGTVFNKTAYSNFGRKEGPRKSFVQSDWEDCVAIDPRSGKWRDYHCDNELFGILKNEKHYICQYPSRTAATVSPGTKPTCPPFNCQLDCGLDGYKSENGCTICKCDQ